MDKFKVLSNFEWVKLARDRSGFRSNSMRYVSFTKDSISATDGHRLHIAPNQTQFPLGAWDFETLTQATEFPDVKRVIPESGRVFTMSGIREVVAICSASETFFRVMNVDPYLRTTPRVSFSFEFEKGKACSVFLNATYFREALRGISAWSDEVTLLVTGKVTATVITMPSLGRQAVVMPVKMDVEDKDSMFSISKMLKQV